MAKVSVIIPNYNHARYLRRRIDTVLGQTYQDLDVLLMDDCSTDDSREVMESYRGESRIRFLFNDTNSGSTFKQWNTGVRESAGEYIWLAESDDYAAPTLLERLVVLLDRNPGVGIAYCESQVVDENDRELRTTHDDCAHVDASGRWRRDWIADGRQECAKYLIRHNEIPNASAALFRRSVYQAAGGADESMRLCGDWKLYAAMLERSDLAHLAETLNYYRTHSQNVRSRMKGWLAIGESLRVQASILNAVPVDPDTLARVHQSHADVWINSWIWQALPDPELKAEVLKYLRAVHPNFGRTIVSRILQRTAKAVCHGRAWHWTRHLLRGRKG